MSKNADRWSLGLRGTQAGNELARLYSFVPATRCVGSGDCCRLTDQEYRDHFATMFPLYRVEYVNVVDFVKRNFEGARRSYLLGFTEERPRRCPFLGEDNSCTIYPARPLICRTYAVMKPETIAAAVERNRKRVPSEWLRRFALRESAMVCPRARVTEPEKVDKHADWLANLTYERELGGLSVNLQLLSDDQQAAFASVTGGSELPLRWSWGGFNKVCASTPDQLRKEVPQYWGKAELADAG